MAIDIPTVIHEIRILLEPDGDSISGSSYRASCACGWKCNDLRGPENTIRSMQGDFQKHLDSRGNINEELDARISGHDDRLNCHNREIRSLQVRAREPESRDKGNGESYEKLCSKYNAHHNRLANINNRLDEQKDALANHDLFNGGVVEKANYLQSRLDHQGTRICNVDERVKELEKQIAALLQKEVDRARSVAGVQRHNERIYHSLEEVAEDQANAEAIKEGRKPPYHKSAVRRGYTFAEEQTNATSKILDQSPPE